MSTPFGTVRHDGGPYVPPTLEGRALIELGATLSRVRRDYDAALDRCDTLAQQLAAALTAVAFWRRQAEALGYDDDGPTFPDHACE